LQVLPALARQESFEGSAIWMPGSGVSEEAGAVLAACFAWSPRRSVTVLLWLLDQGLVAHSHGVSQILMGALVSPQTTLKIALESISLLIPFGPEDQQLV